MFLNSNDSLNKVYSIKSFENTQRDYIPTDRVLYGCTQTSNTVKDCTLMQKELPYIYI